MINSIVPPYMLENITRIGNQIESQYAWDTMKLTSWLQGRRDLLSSSRSGIIPPFIKQHLAIGKVKQRAIYNAQGTQQLPGWLVRSEGQSDSSDVAINEVYNGFGATYDLFKYYGRNSINNNGMTMIGTVHYARNYDNAFWDGQQMVFGDGDGTIFLSFTKPIDVMGHELTHGVTQYTANLNYEGQSGALNESISDVFGSLVKQRYLKQTADQADWLIGAGLFAPSVNGVALRSMKAPGTAYNDRRLGKDPQPDNMKNYLHTTQDNGGVHTNSGIPNHAFYLAAIAIGGRAWEKAGRIWYRALRDMMQANTNFHGAAVATTIVASNLYGNGKEYNAVKDAWNAVGIVV